MRAATTTPVDAVPAFHARLGTAIGLPRYCGESASTTAFRGLPSVHSRCGPHDLLAPYRGRFKKCFSPFVTSWTAPCASGWSESSPGRTFTDGSTVPLQGTHNNACENAIRPFVVGRRNWLFADTVAGANASANLYSLLQTCLANGIDGYRYLRTLLVELPKASTVEDFDTLLPWRLALSDR